MDRHLAAFEAVDGDARTGLLTLYAKITIVVAGASKTAVEKIEKAGGTVTLLSAPAAAE
ncbi:uL15m family ribosomal protein [Rhizobium ruizarguesonis]